MSSDLAPRVERRLVRRATREPEAFRELYRAYFPRVHAYISYRVGRVQDAEDLTAETFLRAVEHLSRFRWRGEGSFAAWLFRIAHNLVANFYRADARWPEPIPLELLPDVRAADDLPADELARKEVLAHLRHLIGDLSPRQQEIAALLDLDERTVAAHLSRGVRRLQEHYEQAAVSTGEAMATSEVSRG